jgi:large repetitive protein
VTERREKPYPECVLASFAVDATAPGTLIARGPADTVVSASVTFAFSSSKPSRFECRLEGGAWVACFRRRATRAIRRHSFEVRAIDGVRHVDSTPAGAEFTVDTSRSRP